MKIITCIDNTNIKILDVDNVKYINKWYVK